MLPAFCDRVSEALRGEDYELVIVDDGSTDGSRELLVELAGRDPRLRSVRLSRNFGHQPAISAGLDQALGEAVVTIDADLQDPPEVIPELIARWRAGADVVHAVRHVRPGEPRARLLAIRAFYRVFGRIAGLPNFSPDSGDFRLIAGPALAAVRGLPERNRFLRGLVAWVGFEQETVVYERAARAAGASKYPAPKLVRLALDGIVSFSTMPLRMAAVMGIVFSGLAFLTIPVVVVLRLLDLYHVSGIASVHILVLLIGGIQLVFLGVVGEYLARTYDEGKQRPIYLLAPAEDTEIRNRG